MLRAADVLPVLDAQELEGRGVVGEELPLRRRQRRRVLRRQLVGQVVEDLEIEVPGFVQERRQVRFGEQVDVHLPIGSEPDRAAALLEEHILPASLQLFAELHQRRIPGRQVVRRIRDEGDAVALEDLAGFLR